MKRLILVILLGVVLALLFRKYCFEVIFVASESMEPAYETGQELLISKITYLIKKPKRNDVVLIKAPYTGNIVLKRIVGLPGEIFSIRNKKVYINDLYLEEEYTQFTRNDTILVGDNIGAFTIPNNYYFVMGDNRDVSRDSRDWSEEEGLQSEPVHKNSIKGCVITLY